MGQSPARLALFGCALVIAGCRFGGEVRHPESGATLEGTVTYGNDKVGAALVVAQNGSGSAQAFVDADGHYKLENVPLGEVSIGVNTEAGKGEAMGRAMAQASGKAKGPPKIIDIPKKFADPATSEIKTQINKGANTFNIVIPK
jgi:hypothetical protein